tara:strand:- start:63 stop:833 length:771 start_codon:yes stop_codon:yes gene_type:complete
MSSESVDEDNLHISNAGSNGQFLQKQSGNSGGLTWASVSSTPEGTAILSTGETGGTKFLREDGDNSCSWQTVPAATSTSGTDNFTIADGNLVIGTADHGIDFSTTSDGTGTTDNELLDDFEEGNWSPILYGNAGGGSNAAATYSFQHGWYQKVGNWVSFAFSGLLTSSNASGNTTYIGGLPFTCANTGSDMNIRTFAQCENHPGTSSDKYISGWNIQSNGTAGKLTQVELGEDDHNNMTFSSQNIWFNGSGVYPTA